LVHSIIPKILFDDLREIGLPARLCKFVENLLSERQVYSFLHQRRLDLAPHKSNVLIFSRHRKGPSVIDSISLRGIDIANTSKVKFLSVILDERLSGGE